jgi:acyl-coenzyme A thioesterase PaaI-like protein
LKILKPGNISPMTTRTELSTQQQAFFDRLRSGAWELPAGIRNLGIKPHEWLKEATYGRTRYEWPNGGDRDINSGRVFGGWIAGFSDHIVSMTMATALEDGEWFTTTELTTRIFRPVEQGLITIEGRLISRGKSTAFVEADWRDEKGRHLVRISAVKAIRGFEELRGPS